MAPAETEEEVVVLLLVLQNVPPFYKLCILVCILLTISVYSYIVESPTLPHLVTSSTKIHHPSKRTKRRKMH